MAKKEKIFEWALFVFLIVFGIGLRFLPHSPNFSPIYSLALFAGFYFSGKKAMLLPITAMAISDIFIGYYEWQVMLSVYASFILTTLFGLKLNKNKNWQNVLAGSLFSALLFFLITNLAVWAFTPWYAKDLVGLTQCFVLAIPFFKNTLISAIFYSGLLFGIFEFSKNWAEKKIFIYAKQQIK